MTCFVNFISYILFYNQQYTKINTTKILELLEAFDGNHLPTIPYKVEEFDEIFLTILIQCLTVTVALA